MLKRCGGIWALGGVLLNSSADLSQGLGRAYGVTTTEVAAALPMARSHFHLDDLRHSAAQETALHMITMAARALLMIGTAILVGEAVAGPGKKLLEGRLHRPMASNEDGEPAD